MKQALLIIRWIVGLLFIFSGLVKVNDPLGLTYKMQEFFDVWGWYFFDKHALYLAIFMNVLEVVCGVALLLGKRMKFFTSLLLLLIIFFTFLTGYALLSGKIKTCGCLGDCLPLTPSQSFIKDLLLLVLIVALFINYKKISPKFNVVLSDIILAITLFVCVFLQTYVLNHLPFYDCLPYKVGNNIVEQMKQPKNYLPDSTSIIYKYNKNGKPIEFDQNNFPADFDSTYAYVNRVDKLIKKGSNEPKIISFNVATLSGTDTTEAIFNTPKYVLVMSNEYPSDFEKWHSDLLTAKAWCDKNSMPFFYITSQSNEALARLSKDSIIILKCDGTIIKTAARVNATYFLMNKATIVNKYSYNDFDKVMNGLIAYHFNFTN
ncbi:MAG: DoxX family protein, partial [Pedobacter sp.]|nr:DoxX family protein [Chitinophagaceae bacterium]